MFRLVARQAVAGLAVVALITLSAPLWAQAPLTAALDKSGLVRVMAGGEEMLQIELNAHGPDWQYAGQATATARATTLPNGGVRRFAGTLPVPNTEGGALGYVQTITPLPLGMKLGYDVSIPKAMRLNGLQVSIILPTARYAAKELVVTDPDSDDPQVVEFPEKAGVNAFQLLYGQGARIEAAKGTPDAATFELIAAADVVVQDLRQWKREVYEVRLPAIMEGEGRDLSPEDRFHLDLTVTFAEPIKIVGP